MGSKTTSQVTQAANPDAQAAYNDVVGKAQSVANTPYQPYGGELVAGLNGGQSAAVSQLQGAYGAAQPFINEGGQYVNAGAQGLGNVQNYLQAGSLATAGAAGYQGLGSASFGQAGTYAGQSAAALGNMAPYMAQAQSMYGQAAGLATPQTFDSAALSQYMSPYLGSVVNATQANLQENDAQQREGLTSSAIGSGAYGGDRAGVAQAELARQQDLADGQTIAGLYQQGYGQALSQFNAVQGQRAQGAQLLAGLGQGYNTLAQDAGQQAQQYGTLAGLSNQTGTGYAGLAANSLGQAGSYNSLGQLQGTTGQAYGTLGGMAGNLGALGQSNLISGASAGLQGATLQQQNAQQQDTAAYNQYMAGLSYPYQNVGFLSNVVQGIGSQEGNTQTTQGNALSQIAGLGTSAIGILGATGGFGANGYLSGLGSTISSAFSDARVKDDIASIGTTHDGQPIYRFRYKGDPKVQMGLMAQDVERRDPGAVGDVGGIKTVDYDRATRGAAMMGLGARPTRATGGPAGLGMSPVGGPTMPGAAPVLAGLGMRPGTQAPAMAMAGLGARPRFDDGGAAIPAGGISFNGVPGGGTAGLGASGLNTNPAGLTAGTPTAHAVQGLGQRPALMTAPPVSAQYASAPPVSFNSAPQAGLGASPSTQDPSSPGFSPGAASGADGGQAGSGASPSGGLSQNAWLAIAAAGAGMASGNSMSFGANVGQGLSAGLRTYETLQQQDRQNAYQQRTLAQTDRQIDLKVQEMHDAAARAQQQLAIESANAATSAQNANTSASATASENATRDQARQIGRYQQVFVPGDGLYVRDLLNPTSPPVRVGTGQASPGATAGAPPSTVAPPVSFNDPPPGGSSPPATPPISSAPPPQGGVSVSGVAPAPGSAGFTSPMPGSAPALQPGFSGSAGVTPQPAGAAPASAPVPTTSRPQAGSAMRPVQVSSDWQPTTSVPQGYVPANSMNIALSGDGGKAQSEIGQKQVEGLQTSAAKATNAQQQLYLMNSAVDALPKTGLIAPGALGDERAKIANSLNTIATTFGAAPVVSPDQVANLQEVQKGAFRLGTQMITDTNGGREAGFILQNSVANVPSLNNSYLGFKRVAAGIDQANQYAIDKANFISDYYAKFHHTDGADALFSKLNPWQNYAQRAIDNSTMPTSRPDGVPPGSQYSMTARMWRGPDGSLYGQNGQAVQR